MLDMPEQQLKQKVQNLEKIEQYLKQQVSELEDDRQELYDLLREDKKNIHELKVKLRVLELSEENLKKKLDQMSEEETRLIGEIDNLTDKIQELELSLILSSQKSETEKSQATKPYLSDEGKHLKSEMQKKDKDILELLKEIDDLKKQIGSSQPTDLKIETKTLKLEKTDMSDKLNSNENVDETESEKDLQIKELKTDLDKLKSSFQEKLEDEKVSETVRNTLLDKIGKNEKEHKLLREQIETLEDKLRMRGGRPKEVQTEESMFDVSRGCSVEVQSDESYFYSKAEKRAATQTDESAFDNKGSITAICQTDDVDISERKLTRNKDVQVDDLENKRSSRNREVQTEDDNELSNKLRHLEKKLLEADDEIKSSKANKVECEEEISNLRKFLLNKESNLTATTQEHEKAVENLRSTRLNLTSAETTRDEKAAIILNKIIEISSLKKNISDKDEEVKTLWTDMNKIQLNYSNYIDTSEKERILLENESRHLGDEIINKDKELKMTNNEHQKTAEKLRLKEDEIRSLTSNQNQTLSELTSMKKNLKDKEGELQMLLDDLNNLQAKHATLIQDHEDISKLEEELMKKLETCKRDLKLSRDKNVELTMQLDAKETKLEFLQSSNSELEGKVQSQEDEIIDLQQKQHKAELKNEFLNSTNEQRMRLIANTIMKHQAEKNKDENLTSSQIAFLKKSLQSKDEEIQLLTEDVNGWHKKYLDLLQKTTEDPNGETVEHEMRRKNNERLTSELLRREDEIKTLANNEEQLQKKFLNLFEMRQLEKDGFEKDKSKLMKELRDKILNIDDKSKKLELTSQELKDAKIELSEYETKFNDIRTKLLQVTNALKLSSQQNKELLICEKNSKEIFKENEDLGKQMEQMEKNRANELTSLRSKLEGTLKDNGALEKALENSRNHISKLEEDGIQKQYLEMQINHLLKSHQEKDKQIQASLEKISLMRNQIKSLQDEKKEFIEMDIFWKNLQKQFDQLSVVYQKQKSDTKALQAKEMNLNSQLKEKDTTINELNLELAQCMELSRKLNILNISK